MWGTIMDITNQSTPQATLKELTARFERFRVESGLTQSQLAAQAGVSKRIVERIENGCDLQITTLVRLLRVLRLADRLDQLIPEPTVSLMDMLKGKTEAPKRARQKKQPAGKKVQMGDE